MKNKIIISAFLMLLVFAINMDYSNAVTGYKYKYEIYGNISALTSETYGIIPLNLSINGTYELFWCNFTVSSINSTIGYVYWNNYDDYVCIDRNESDMVFTLTDEGDISDHGEPENTLVSWFRLNNENINDSSIYYNDGFLVGVGNFLVDAKIGHGINMNGSGTYIDTTKDIGDDNSGSVMLWFRPNENYENGISGNYRTFLFKGYTGNDQIILRYNGDGTGTFSFYVNDGSYHAINYATTFTANTWYHLAATWSASNMNLFVNGINVSQGPGYMPQSGTDAWFTVNLDDSTYNNGTFDEVRIYNRTLSYDEIRLIYFSQNSFIFNSSDIFFMIEKVYEETEFCYDDDTLYTMEFKIFDNGTGYYITHLSHCPYGCSNATLINLGKPGCSPSNMEQFIIFIFMLVALIASAKVIDR